MPAKNPSITSTQLERISHLGQQLREARKRQNVSATAAAEAAGMSRVTLHRIEAGEPAVTMGAWLAAADALGLQLGLIDASAAASPPLPVTDNILLADYPQLKALAWQMSGITELSPQEALALYERNWRHVERDKLTMKEIALINALAITIGGGRALV